MLQERGDEKLNLADLGRERHEQREALHDVEQFVLVVNQWVLSG